MGENLPENAAVNVEVEGISLDIARLDRLEEPVSLRALLRKPRKGSRTQPELTLPEGLPHPVSWWESREAAIVGALPHGIMPARTEREERRVLDLEVVPSIRREFLGEV